MNVLSLFSGCGGMDIGFEGGFECLRDSINSTLHPDWIDQTNGDWVVVKKTGFNTVFANDIRPDAKAAWRKKNLSRLPKRCIKAVSVFWKLPILQTER